MSELGQMARLAYRLQGQGDVVVFGSHRTKSSSSLQRTLNTVRHCHKAQEAFVSRSSLKPTLQFSITAIPNPQQPHRRS